jgi:hypothetical protein
VFGRLFRADRIRWLTPGTMLLSSSVAATLAVVSLWVPAALLLVVFSWSISTTINAGITYRQLAAPDDLRSSVNVLGRMVSWGGQPFGAATGAVVAGAAGVPVAYAGAAVVMGLTGLTAALLLNGPARRATPAVSVQMQRPPVDRAG